MTAFIIQAKDYKISHDFSFHLIESIEYQNWFHNEERYKYLFTEKPYETSLDTFYPIGDTKFTIDFLKLNNKLNENKTRPINIPPELNDAEFLKRKVAVSSSNKNPFNTRSFVKSNSQYKSFLDMVEPGKHTEYEDNEYFFSEEIEIESEWRGFVHHGRLVDIRHYAGNFRKFPDLKIVDKMIDKYRNAPNAYTIDIGINDKEQFLIEVHPFFSCGLYGFSDYKILPQMMIEGVQYIIS